LKNGAFHGRHYVRARTRREGLHQRLRESMRRQSTAESAFRKLRCAVRYRPTDPQSARPPQSVRPRPGFPITGAH
jgi:hypothetical protein